MYTVMHDTGISTYTCRLDDGQKLVPDSGIMLIDSESLKILLPKGVQERIMLPLAC